LGVTESMMATHLLIVEDEEDLLGPLAYDLSRAGFVVELARRGSEALSKLSGPALPELVLLDLMLPDLSGEELCRRIRASEETATLPIIMLTAKGEERDRVQGFELGADDYVVKPFSTRELILRIQALLRRSPEPSEGRSFKLGCLEVDFEAPSCRVEGQEVELTALERKLLRTLIERRGRVQTRGQLLQEVWGASEEMVTRTVDTHIRRLRQKLGPAGEYVETLRGEGYRFQLDPAEAPADSRRRPR